MNIDEPTSSSQAPDDGYHGDSEATHQPPQPSSEPSSADNVIVSDVQQPDTEGVTESVTPADEVVAMDTAAVSMETAAGDETPSDVAGEDSQSATQKPELKYQYSEGMNDMLCCI